jgi:hypothetical protein
MVGREASARASMCMATTHGRLRKKRAQVDGLNHIISPGRAATLYFQLVPVPAGRLLVVYSRIVKVFYLAYTGAVDLVPCGSKF